MTWVVRRGFLSGIIDRLCRDEPHAQYLAPRRRLRRTARGYVAQAPRRRLPNRNGRSGRHAVRWVDVSPTRVVPYVTPVSTYTFSAADVVTGGPP